MPNQKILYFVGAPLINLDDITVRALSILKRVDVILCESIAGIKRILRHHRIEILENQLFVYDEKKVKLEHIQDEILKFNQIAYVSDAGMPIFMDPGSRLIDFAKKNEYQIKVIPGVSALSIALVYGNINSSFYFAGYPPLEKDMRIHFFKKLSTKGIPVLFFETPYRLPKLLLELKTYFKGNWKITFFFDLTGENEKIVSFLMKDANKYEKEIHKAPAVILIQK